MNPRKRASAYDRITIGGILSPGICTMVSPVNRKTEFDIQGQPGYANKVPVPKQQEIIRVSYKFTMWEDQHFDAWDVLVQRLERARKSKVRPEALVVIDPRLDGMNATKFLVEGFSSEEQIGDGKWARTVYLIEYVERIKIASLPADKANQDAFKTESEAATAERLKVEAEFKAKIAELLRQSQPVSESFLAGLL